MHKDTRFIKTYEHNICTKTQGIIMEKRIVIKVNEKDVADFSALKEKIGTRTLSEAIRVVVTKELKTQ
jgi:hypothetical protein